jgi:mono/diheme cytochrome c family protein
MMKKLLVPLSIIPIILLTACNFSLAADVTPPPGARAPVAAPQAQQPAQSQQISGPLYPLVAPNPAAGADIFAEKCAPCHGATGLGDGPQASGLPNPVAPIGTAELARNATPAQWYTAVTQGNMERFMPPFPSLNDRQRWDVIAYMLSLSEPAGGVEQGKALYQANCVGCHGETGKGDGPQAAGKKMPDFLDQEKMAGQSAASLFQVISSGKADMPAWSDKLSEDQRWALASYLRSLTFTTVGDLAAATPEPGQPTLAAGVLETPVASQAVITPTVGTGAVSGLVTNASGGDLPAGAEVMLHGFDAMQMVVTKTATLAPDGSYTVPGLEMPDGRMYFSSIQHQGVTYGSEVGTVVAGENQMDLPITIYDVTQDATALKIDRLHLFFEQVDPQTMRVAELFVISNTGNKTIIPSEAGQPTISFKLPAGFQDLQFQDGEVGGRYIQTPDGFGDTANIYPGQGNYTVLLAYNLPYNRKLELSQTMTLPADAVVVLVPQQHFKLKGENLSPAGTRDVSGVTYQMYDMNGVKANDQLNLTVSNNFSLAGTTRNNLVIGLGALGLVLILGGVWLYWRNRARVDEFETGAAVDEEGVAVPGANAESSEELMDAILALDDLYHAGQIPEEAYIQRRAELKERLKEALG